MKIRGLVGLALVVAALGAFVYWVERDWSTTDEREAEENKIILWEPTEVDGLEIQRGDERTLLSRILRSTDDVEPLVGTGEWSLQAPMEARADGAGVDALLAKLVALEKKRTLEDVGRRELGLDPPEWTITLSQGEETRVVEVGAEVPGSSNRILALGDQVFLVEGTFLEDLRRAPGEWRSKALFPGSQADVNRIEVSSSEDTFTLEKRESSWWIESPFKDFAAEDRVSQFLLALTGLQATDFVDESVDGEPVLRLEIGIASREEAFSLDWDLSRVEEGPVLVRLGDQVARVDDTLGEYLESSAEAWRSRSWIHTHSYEVESFRVESLGEALDLEKVDGAWMKGEEERGFAEVSDFFFTLSEPRAEAFLTDQDLAFMKKIVAVHLNSGGDVSETAELYEAEDGTFLAISSEREVALRMPPGVQEKVLAAVEALQNPVENEAEESLLPAFPGSPGP